MAVDGVYETVVKSPMGDQKATLTIQTSGDTFTGQYSGAMGTTEVKNGKSDGDTITGSVTAGAFGSFPLTGTRVS